MRVRTQRCEPRLAAFAIAVVLGLQEGLLLAGLRAVSPTRIPSWLGVLTPVALVGTAAMTLVALRPRPGVWWLFGAGATIMVEGHGVHLAANALSHGRFGDAHVWDEVIGHHLLFAGVAVVFAAVFVALADRTLHVGRVGYLLAAAVGITLFNSYVEGATPVLGLATCAGFLVAGWQARRTPRGVLALVTFTTTLLLLLGWGAYWQGFPEFSDLGWI